MVKMIVWMKKHRIKSIITIGFVLLLLAFAVCSFYRSYILVQNVFDHMFYARAHNNIISEIRSSKAEYHFAETSFSPFGKDGYIDLVTYHSNYINSGFNFSDEKILIRVDSPLSPMYSIFEEHEYEIATFGSLRISYVFVLSPTKEVPYSDEIEIGYEYSVENKELTPIFTILREDKNNQYVEIDDAMVLKERDNQINPEKFNEIRKFMLDYVLTDWFEANAGNTKFSMVKLGRFEFSE